MSYICVVTPDIELRTDFFLSVNEGSDPEWGEEMCMCNSKVNTVKCIYVDDTEKKK